MMFALTALVLAGFAAPWLCRAWGPRAAGRLALLPAALFAWFLAQIPAVRAGDSLVQGFTWLPGLGFDFTLYLDGLALLFALLITGIGAFVVWYSGAYLKEDPAGHRFIAVLFLFMASMLGVVLADNVLVLFVFWELTSFTSYLLIGHHHEDESSRKSALQALLVTGLGGLFLLAGLILLGLAGDSYDLSVLMENKALAEHPLFPAALGLLLVGAFTKSAQFPFHFWLPNAMAAPTPASAYLHSSTMVKAGVYLLARLHPVASESALWLAVVPVVGAATLGVGACMAYGQTILKRLLAYTTVAALGAMVLLLGLGTAGAAKAAMTFLLAHALYKASLFLVAGIIDHETGEKDVRRLGGLRTHLPWTACGAGLAAVSMMGVPPTFGFLGKELLYAAGEWPWVFAVSVLAGVFFFVVAALTGLKPFLGAVQPTPHTPHHEAPVPLWAGPVVMGALGVLFGLAAPAVGHQLIGPAVSSVLGQPAEVKLALWHGWNKELMWSLATLAMGGAALALLPRIRPALERLAGITAWGPDRAYQGALALLNTVAKGQTRILQSGSLRTYLEITLLFVLVTGGTWMLRTQPVPPALAGTPITMSDVVIVTLILVATLGAVFSPSRMAAIASLGVVGYAVALLFVLYGAPDLAMTQLVIETLTVILFVLAFHRLPPFTRRSSARLQLLDILPAALVGIFMAALTLAANRANFAEPISGFFAEHSWKSAYGKNIVNVILVDFRALDTLGEITVLAVAGLGVIALLKLRLVGKGGPS